MNNLPEPTTEIVAAVFGAVLLLFGKRLFWFFVGGAGFLAGVTVAGSLPGIEGKSDATVLIVGVIFGVIGIVGAIFLKNVALRIAGFLVGVLIAYYAVELMQITDPVWMWTTVGAGGLVGLLLIVTVFEAALVILSSTTGAMMILTSVPVPASLENAFFIGLSILGIVVQFQLMKSSKPKPEKKE